MLKISYDMDGHIQKSPKVGHVSDGDDTNYVSGLSTVLVATIQEVKDRITHIEHIFCNQLYPNFQSKSKGSQKIYCEVNNAAENTWKKKEYNLLLQIEKLELERHKALEEEKSLKEQEEKMKLILSKFNNQILKINKLEKELRQKSEEVDKQREVQSNLLELVKSKSSIILNNDKQLKEHEEKTIVLLAKLSSLDKKVDDLQEELRGKTEEVGKGKELREILLKNIELQALEIKNKKQLLNDHEKEKKHLTAKLEHLEQHVGELQKELNQKTKVFNKGGGLQEHMSNTMQLQVHEIEKTHILAKVKCLEEKVNDLQVRLSERSKEAAVGSDQCTKLLKEIEFKASELVAEKKKRRDLTDSYRRLKSQYNFVCAKFGLTTESMLPQNILEDRSDSLRPQQNPKASTVACDINKVKNEISISENLEDKKEVRSVENSSFHSPAFSSHTARKCPNVKSAPVAGAKRPVSLWRDTRSGGGHDPHDDFLDTPFENIIGNLNKALKVEVLDHPIPAPKNMNFDGSDDETQDINVDHNPQKQHKSVPRTGKKDIKVVEPVRRNDMNFDGSDDETQDMNVDPNQQKQHEPVPRTGQKDIKYVEPVRKKADRENLKGIDCKQCKKFYEAVLPNNGGKDTNGNKMDFRCEHHDGVSRHRYRYVPPLTPEGFWNIGFESEM